MKTQNSILCIFEDFGGEAIMYLIYILTFFEH